MDIADAIILGIIQGLTEFLPVSSSGHLEIGREVLNADLLAAENLLFTIVLHFATALSTIIIFKDDIIELLRGSISNSINGDHKYLFKIIISMIPAVLIGLFFGLLLFPNPDFSKSILVGTLLVFDLFPQVISSSLLFWSFLVATLAPAIAIVSYDSFKRR